MRHFFSVIGLFLRYIKHYPKMKLLFWGSLAINSKLWYEHIYFTKFYKSTLNLRKTKQVCLYLQKLCHLSQYDCVHGKQGKVFSNITVLLGNLCRVHINPSHITLICFPCGPYRGWRTISVLLSGLIPSYMWHPHVNKLKNRSELYQ